MSNLWEVTNKIDELNSSLFNVKSILELIAMDTQDPHSGATWAAMDMLSKLSDDLDGYIQELLSINRKNNQIQYDCLEKNSKKIKKK